MPSVSFWQFPKNTNTRESMVVLKFQNSTLLVKRRLTIFLWQKWLLSQWTKISNII